MSYNPLWKLLIDKGMNKTDLAKLTGLSATTIAKLGRGGNVTTDVLARICEALDCDIADICEVQSANQEEHERT
ncbi:helix-turn-helix domain-containing protein [Varibaculum vaginae]|uniref:helix-turn-helix domain-containing protein n=1 Tax=Varibaculum vaginae TaxID=2364797 RepID=UPI001F392E3B|nr:helix-turn-helix transcriptional regulator [Varibaculum vaginae]